LTETKNEDTQIISLKKEISELLAENRQFKYSCTETQTQLALSRSEITNLKTLFEEKQIELDE
jgi:dimeric dUTPase (all-alpha-NTP-PPase superfamily)